jgi:hypothetical protein
MRKIHRKVLNEKLARANISVKMKQRKDVILWQL